MITFGDFLDDYYDYKSREEVHLPDFMERSGMDLLYSPTYFKMESI